MLYKVKNMIRRILMIAENDICSKSSLGVTRKIRGQYKAFQNMGYDVFLLCLENGEGVLIHENCKKVVVPKRIKAYFTVARLYLNAAKICAEEQIDCCYIRYPLADWTCMKMLKSLYKKHSKVIVEIPTYPYDEVINETGGFVPKFNYFQDKINRKQLQMYVDYIVTYSRDKNIFGIKCINIGNGIDIQDVCYIGDKLKYKSDIILIAVALVVYGHGYDRILRSLNDYYKGNNQRKIIFNIVGNGPELPNLKKMVNEYGLSNYVHFYGAMYGENLNKVFMESNIGVGGLAGHREKLKTVSPLKSREYCAKGIPFFSTSKDDAFPEDKCPFYRLFPANDDPIDIEKVIEFYDYIKAHPEIHQQMRTYAEENLTWEKQLKKVMKEIE